MDPQKPEKYHRVSYVAERLSVSKSLIYFLVSTGELRHVKHGRRKGIRISDGAIDEYMHRLRHGADDD